MRARLVGPDGLSYFVTLDYDEWRRSRLIRRRFESERIDDMDMAMAHVVERGALAGIRVITEEFKREVWHIPVGPLACEEEPDRHDPPGARFDVVFRFVS